MKPLNEISLVDWKAEWKDAKNLIWPANWGNERGDCIICEHGVTEHTLLKGGDDVNRVFCRNCSLNTMRLMGDEGIDTPMPFFVEAPTWNEPCFLERGPSGKMGNFLPLSPGDENSNNLAYLCLRAEGGGESSEIRLTGVAWHSDEFERLRPGDEVDVPRYKLHLYWVQEGRCLGCHRLIAFDLMEVDRITPGDNGPGYTVGNIQLLCSGCNRIKGKGTMDYLLERRRSQGLNQTKVI